VRFPQVEVEGVAFQKETTGIERIKVQRQEN
jgi:hypothetical protein